MKYFLVLLLHLSTYSFLIAQESDSLHNESRVFQLGEVIVLGSFNKSANTVSSNKMEKFNRVDISNALNILPGVTLANVGPRNESVVYIRGFDLRQVPVFLDSPGRKAGDHCLSPSSNRLCFPHKS